MSWLKTIAKAGNKQIKNRIKERVKNKMPEKKWKQWCCKTLDEEEIKLVADTMPGYNFEEFTEEQIERIAKRFRKMVSDLIGDWVWEIKQAIESEIE